MEYRHPRHRWHCTRHPRVWSRVHSTLSARKSVQRTQGTPTPFSLVGGACERFAIAVIGGVEGRFECSTYDLAFVSILGGGV